MHTDKNKTFEDIQERELTYGEKAVGLTFNPGRTTEVDKIKILSAKLIDELHEQIETIHHRQEARFKQLVESTPCRDLSREESQKYDIERNAIYASGNEQAEQFMLAIRRIQEGQMWGVKAATWRY